MTGGPTFLAAFVAGVASFASPCMLPVLPAFMAQLAGSSLGRGAPGRWDLLLGATLFVAGFSLVFAVLGVAMNAALAGLGAEVMVWVSRAAGILVIVLGLQMTGLLRFPIPSREPSPPGAARLGPLLFGASFGVAWTPCVGPVLGSTLALAATRPAEAFPLLLAYAAGLGAPFLLVGLFPSRAFGLLRGRGRLAVRLQAAFGLLLVGMGALVFAGKLNMLANFWALKEVLP